MVHGKNPKPKITRNRHKLINNFIRLEEQGLDEKSSFGKSSHTRTQTSNNDNIFFSFANSSNPHPKHVKVKSAHKAFEHNPSSKIPKRPTKVHSHLTHLQM